LRNSSKDEQLTRIWGKGFRTRFPNFYLP